MRAIAADLEFQEAARLRDDIHRLEALDFGIAQAGGENNRLARAIAAHQLSRSPAGKPGTNRGKGARRRGRRILGQPPFGVAQPNMDEPPDPIRSAIAGLWTASFESEASAFKSGRFRLLEQLCSSTYPEIANSRLRKRSVSDLNRQQLRSAIEHFFGWTGAPWYEGPCPDATETARSLHAAFLMSEVQWTHFVPLDRFMLMEPGSYTIPCESTRHLRFGPCELMFLEERDLTRRVPVAALRRFGGQHRLPTERLAGRYWLIVPSTEKAEPVGRISEFDRFLDSPWGEIGRTALYEATYPEPVENALFILLLCPCLVKNPSDSPWKPFAVPWIYSLTDDRLAEPPHAPDPPSLTWQPVGDEHHEFEAPYFSEYFKVTREKIEEGLRQRWRQLQAALKHASSAAANFHPLTKHFFVKALGEQGIDEIVANLSCIEATLMLREHNGRKKMMDRYKRLVADGSAYNWLDHAYHLRDRYLHSLGNPTEAISWEELARTRWSVVKAVDAHLSLTETHSGIAREGLLRSLD